MGGGWERIFEFYLPVRVLQDERVNKTVKDEIVNMVMSKLRLIFGSSGKPGWK